MIKYILSLVLFVSPAFALKPFVKSADIINNDGQKIGTIQLVQGTEGVVINLKVEGLPELLKTNI